MFEKKRSARSRSAGEWVPWGVSMYGCNGEKEMRGLVGVRDILHLRSVYEFMSMYI